MVEEEAVDVFKSLVERDPHVLDRPAEELGPLVFIGNAAVDAYRRQLSRLDRMENVEAQRKATLVDAQHAASLVLAVEGKIGEAYAKLPQLATNAAGRRRADVAGTKQGFRDVTGMSGTSAKEAAVIAANPGVVEEVIREAEEKGDVPTKTAVLRKVSEKRSDEIARKPKVKNKLTLGADELRYITRLDQAVSLIPHEPPQDVTEEGLLAMATRWAVIFKRGEKFRE